MADGEDFLKPWLPHAVGHRRILSSIALLGAATTFAKCIALAKDLLVARQLGAGDALDAYLVAMVLPSYAVVVLAHTFASGFVPTYVQLWKREDLAAAQQLAGSVLSVALAVLLAVTCVVLATSPFLLPIIGSGFEAVKLQLARELLLIVSGVVLCTGVSAVLAAVLNAHERFAAVALAPMAIPLGTLIVFALYGSSRGVQALAAGTLVGFAGETVLLALAAWRVGLLPRPCWPAGQQALSRVGRQYLPVALGGLLMSSSLVIDQSMAASLGSGQVSVLNYGSKVVAVVLAVVATSVSTVLFPRFAHELAAGRAGTLVRTFAWYAVGVLLVSIPGIALLAIVSEPLVRLLFERGAFTTETTAAVSWVQICLLPQIPFYVLAMLGARVLSALEGNVAVLWIAAVNVVVNVSGNLLLMRLFGVAGIAMATSLMYLIATLVTLLAMRSRLKQRRAALGTSDA